MCNFEAFSKYVFNNTIIKHLNFVLSVLWYIIMLFEFYTLNIHILLYNKYICKQESKSGLFNCNYTHFQLKVYFTAMYLLKYYITILF